MEYRLFTIVRYNYRDYNTTTTTTTTTTNSNSTYHKA
jgi:hypothetical protein